MDFTNNVNINGNKPSLHKSRSNASFSHAAVTKSDVGDFQEGYFVMAEMPSLPQRNKPHKTPERNQRKSEHANTHRQQSREQSTKDLDQLVQRESDINVSTGRITPSPTRSPTRNKRISPPHSPQRPHQTTTYTDSPTNVVPVSPHKPRKAQSQPHIQYEKRVERTGSSPLFSSELPSSPSKQTQEKGPSPPRDRWAGPAFGNAPPPSSLPIPDFPPFNPSSPPANPSILSSSPPPSSLPLPGPSIVPQQPIVMYHEPPQYIPLQPPAYPPVAYHGYPLHLVYDPQPTLAQLSTDLRRMLNIGGQPLTQPIPA